MVEINKELLKRVIDNFRVFQKEEGKKWEEERERKNEFFSENFSKERIDDIDEGVLRELIYKLWSFAGWTNKDYILQEMLKSGLDEIKQYFKYLLYSDDQISKRFDKIRLGIRMMGSACVSEILAHHDHNNYAIWNRRSKDGLIFLGVTETSFPRAAQINGMQYESFCQIAKEILSQVSLLYDEFKDLFVLDFLLYYIAISEPKTAIKVVEDLIIKEEDFDHDATIDQVLELGDGLGFDVQKEVKIVKGCQIDAIWRSRIANLGTIIYAFEVHRSGNPDSAILNLQRVKRDPSVQKVIIVSSEEKLSEFREEISSLDEDFRNSVGYFEVNDLQKALLHLDSLKDLLKELGLLSPL